jgi:uncharacterized membrane protein
VVLLKVLMLERFLALNLPKELIVTLISMVPVFELRGALPVAINVFGFPWYYALFFSILGNILPVPFLLLFWDGLSRLFYHIGFLKRPLDWLFERTRKQSVTIGKYKFWGLLVFVAVPIPLTGAWTASLVAVLLGMQFWPSFLSIFGGVIVAGVIVTALSLMGWTGAIIAIVAFIALMLWGLFRKKAQPVAAKPVEEKIKP